MRDGCFPARFQPSVVSSTGARWTVDSAPRRSCLIVKLTRGAPTQATQPGSMGGSGATWTRRLRDALGSISRVCCWKRVLCHRGLMQLLGGGRGEPAWGYCGSSIHAARVVACGSGAVACLSAVGSNAVAFWLQHLVTHSRCRMPRHSYSVACVVVASGVMGGAPCSG